MLFRSTRSSGCSWKRGLPWLVEPAPGDPKRVRSFDSYCSRLRLVLSLRSGLFQDVRGDYFDRFRRRTAGSGKFFSPGRSSESDARGPVAWPFFLLICVRDRSANLKDQVFASFLGFGQTAGPALGQGLGEQLGQGLGSWVPNAALVEKSGGFCKQTQVIRRQPETHDF